MDFQKKMSEKAAITLAIFIAGLCSLIYELLISTTTSYFLGDSIRQFSLTIGIYMAAMGLGSYLSKYFSDEHLAVRFIVVEALLGIIGGSSVPLLYYGFERLSPGGYIGLMVVLTAVVGLLTGFEIPLLARIMKKYYPLRVNLANVMSLDYFGALAATLLFPFLLLPFFGVFRTSVFFGLVNIALGVFILWYFSEHIRKQTANWLYGFSLFSMLAFAGLLYFARPILMAWDGQSFSHRVVFSKQTPYQHLILTRNKEEIRLYINRIIQFSSADEYRYHEALALLPLQAAPYRKNILVLGGGEGLLARELLKEPSVESITIIDLDPEVFRLARENPYIRALNEGALGHPKVRTFAMDAAAFLRESNEYYDLIIADLPDPSNEAVARLYSTHFFRLARNRLASNGVFATQASSPFHTRNAFWCIYETLRQSGFGQVLPYHTYVPSFGDWGFIMASRQPLEVRPFRTSLPVRYLDEAVVDAMFDFPRDSDNPGGLKPNRLDQPALLEYYLADWSKWSREKIR
ncbi:MAG: polyamine aminopropyltransferase [Phaeodactylibacter sp.]|nr:polyamine aminopropyltransferase [Phaeodactylibacter sp.]MCB9051603.1 polyamine aminopropyltransferase [Lewinellaceae bacterium]